MILKCREKRKQMEKTDIISRTRTFEQPLPCLRERKRETHTLLIYELEHQNRLLLKRSTQTRARIPCCRPATVNKEFNPAFNLFFYFESLDKSEVYFVEDKNYKNTYFKGFLNG